MEFTIYTIGDGAFMEQVLIAVKMLTQSPTFAWTMRILAGLAIIFIGFGSVMNLAKDFNVTPIFVGFIAYQALLGITVPTTFIHSRTTGEVRVVSDMPLGISAVGGIITSIGKNFSDAFETAFSTVGYDLSLTEGNSYLESLHMINNVRKNIAESKIYSVLDNAAGFPFSRSFKNYVAECTSPKILLNKISKEEMRSTNINDLIRYNTDINSRGTLSYTSLNPRGEFLTCGVAYQQIESDFNRLIQTPEVQGTLAESLVRQRGGILESLNPRVDGSKILNKANGLITLLSGHNISGMEYIKALVKEKFFYDGRLQHFNNFADATSHVMMIQALEQRNTKWAAEHSMFLNSMVAIISFLEALVFALFPFVILMLIIGKIGIMTSLKYFVVLLWVQLWQPLLAIVNMYIIHATKKQMSFLDSNNFTSIYGLDNSAQIAQDWIAVGGMFATFVPVLALFIISGSYYTMNSIATKMSSASEVNPKVTSPDAITPSPMLMPQAMYQANNYSHLKSGSEGMMGTLNLSSVASSALGSSKQAVTQSMDSLMNAWKNLQNSTAGRTFARNTMRSLTNQLLKNDGFLEQKSVQKVIQAGHTMGLSQEESIQGIISHSLGLSGSASASQGLGSIMKGNLTGSLNSQLGKSFASKEATSLSSNKTNTLNESLSEGEKKDIMESISKALANTDLEGLKLDESDSTQKEFAKAHQTARSKMAAYQETQNQVAQIGTAQSVKWSDLASMIRQNPNSLKEASQLKLKGNSNVWKNAKDIANSYIKYGGVSEKDASIVGLMQAMMNKGNFASQKEFEDAQQAVFSVVSPIMGNKANVLGAGNNQFLNNQGTIAEYSPSGQFDSINSVNGQAIRANAEQMKSSILGANNTEKLAQKPLDERKAEQANQQAKLAYFKQHKNNLDKAAADKNFAEKIQDQYPKEIWEKLMGLGGLWDSNFDKNSIETLLENNGRQGLVEAYKSVGLTDAQAQYAIETNNLASPLFGFLVTGTDRRRHIEARNALQEEGRTLGKNYDTIESEIAYIDKYMETDRLQWALGYAKYLGDSNKSVSKQDEQNRKDKLLKDFKDF